MSDHATDDLVKLHVCGSRYFGNLAHETKDPGVCKQTLGQMCEGSTSRIVLRHFQLESLILAQNERWRQA